MDPLALLTAGADNLNPAPRGRALALLIADVGPDPWGRRALLDPSNRIRRQAIEALGQRGDPVSLALLEGVASDPEADPYLRGLAAMRSPGPASARAIARALEQEQEPWRIAPLALAAVQLGDARARIALSEAVATGELPLDLAFLETLGRSGEPSLIEALTQAQDRVEDEIALAVAAARLRLGDPAGEQELRRALSEEDEERSLEALDLLVEIDHPSAESLLRRASAQGTEMVRWYADLALAADEGRSADLFARASVEPDRELRALAVRFAGRALTPAAPRRVERIASRVVIEALSDPDASVRIEACRIAAGLRLREAEPEASRLLSDENELVRIEAAAVLLALEI